MTKPVILITFSALLSIFIPACGDNNQPAVDIDNLPPVNYTPNPQPTATGGPSQTPNQWLVSQTPTPASTATPKPTLTHEKCFQRFQRRQSAAPGKSLWKSIEAGARDYDSECDNR